MTKADISPSNITLIGEGKVGSSLYQSLKRGGYQVKIVGKNKNEQLKFTQHADLVLITVQDSYIKQVCDHIASVARPKTIIAHCSGALSSKVLTSAKEQGCFIGSAHPLNTFPNISSAKKILTNPSHGTYCFISGNDTARHTLHHVFSSLGFNAHYMDDNSKTMYHAACVFLCNYLTSLSEIGLQTAEQAGLNRDEFWAAVQPLIQTTLNNISSQGTTSALSGPIVRGDIETVTGHLNALRNSSELILDTYKILGQQAIELSRNKLEDDKSDALKALLSNNL